MNLVPANYFRDLTNFDHDLSNFFDDFPLGRWGRNHPKVDVYQTETHVIVKAELPGVAKEDLDVHVDENTIRISGQTRRGEEYKENHVYRTERYYGSFSRTIPLPAEVEAEAARAEYRDGILTMTVPKQEPAKQKSHKVDVQ